MKSYLVNTIGNRLKYLLFINELSGSQLAKKAKVHQPLISKIINSSNIPNEKKVLKLLSEFFQIEEEWLSNGEISKHGCSTEFRNTDTICSDCEMKLSDFITERFWLKESEIELPLLNKLKLIKQYNKYISNIDSTIENLTNDIQSTSVKNLSECENALELKERVFGKIEKLKKEFDKECHENFTLEYYLDDRNWIRLDDDSSKTNIRKASEDLEAKMKALIRSDLKSIMTRDKSLPIIIEENNPT